ncbi:MAG: hypothetical protein K5669_06175 [Lachnospiraceae bacterium]|nr:hypothetical protein [Lachnospiraceae bacterium]
MFNRSNKSSKVFIILGAGITGLVFLILLFLTFFTLKYYFSPDAIEDAHLDDLVIIPVSIGVIVLSFVLGKALKAARKKIKFLDWLIVCVLTLIWSYITIKFVTGAKEQPGSDSYACFVLAKQFLNLDYSAVVPKDSYLSLWPFQTGFIFILEKMMRIFNTTDPIFFQIVNVLYCALGMISGYGILREYTDREELMIIYMLVAFSDFILGIECVEVYGNIPCFQLMVFATWMFIRAYKSRHKIGTIVYMLLCGGATILASVYKGNAKIFVIALCITGLFMFIKDRSRWKQLVVILIISVISLSAVKVTCAYYEKYAGNTMGKGVPAVAFIAMGLQEGGGWNGFHANTYMETGYDYDATVKISKDNIKESLKGYSNDPAKAAKQIYGKSISQWCYESRGAFWSVNAIWKEPRSDFALRVINGDLKNIICNIANVRLGIIYIILLMGTFMAFVRIIRDEFDDTVYLGLIFFIGGYIFSMIWEAHTGYLLPYVMVLFPMLLPTIFNRMKKVQNVQ